MEFDSVTELTQRERENLLYQLLDASAIGSFLDTTRKVVLIRIGGDVAPDKTETLTCIVHMNVRLRRFVILEPYSDVVEEERVILRRFTGQPLHEERVVKRSRQHVPRGAWQVHQAFGGCVNAFPSMPNTHGIGGDAFGPNEDNLDLVLPGLTFTLSVSHGLSEVVPFRGVLIGELLESRTASYVTSNLDGTLIPINYSPPGENQ